MRVAVLLSLIAVSFLNLGQAGETTPMIQHVTPRHVPENTFKRVSEYFTGQENTGGNVILRTQAETRAGFYFILSLKGQVSAFPHQSQVVLHYISSDAPKPTTVRFPLTASPATAKEIWVGLTDSDAPKHSDEIVAWKIEIVDSTSNVLATRQSFLWAMPGDN